MSGNGNKAHRKFLRANPKFFLVRFFVIPEREQFVCNPDGLSSSFEVDRRVSSQTGEIPRLGLSVQGGALTEDLGGNLPEPGCGLVYEFCVLAVYWRRRNSVGPKDLSVMAVLPDLGVVDVTLVSLPLKQDLFLFFR